MIITEKRIKRQAELVESKFGTDHSESLEFVAKLNGFKNWDHYTKELKKDDSETPQGFSLSSVLFNLEEIHQLLEARSASFLTAQVDRFDLMSSELPIDTILKLDDEKTCSFYFIHDFLKAKIVEGYLKSQGKQTALFYDTASDEKLYDILVIWVIIPFKLNDY